MPAAPPERPGSAQKAPHYLPALDGLRAGSVLAVLGFHGQVPKLGGGFLGVEVFFVISGYLITSLLLLEQEHAGSICLPQFWRRRARRLLPAVCALLIATLLLTLALAPEALAQTRGDSIAALFYVSNWWQIVRQHSYFMDVDRPPLLLHLWSLSVEEQFYLAWPLALALFGRSARRWVLPVALLGGAASACWMARLFDPALDPTRVYVGSDSRLSGLLLGAALSVLVPLGATPHAPPSRTSRLWRDALAAAGVSGLCWAMVRLRSQDPFLYRGGLVLVDLASCALIASVVTRSSVARLLGAAPLAWVGRRSYGLYLWHWPIFALTRPELDLTLEPVPLFALRLALTFGAAEASYRFVEMPVRRGALSALLNRLRLRTITLAATATLSTAVALALVSIPSARSAAAGLPTRPSGLTAAPPVAGAAPLALSPAAASLNQATELAPFGIPLDPTWPKTLTLLSDSVGLALSQSLPAALPGWKVEILGRPALMVKQVVPEFLNARAVGSVVVIALAYNSLFERERKNYERWSGVWDRNAENLLRDLKACGAKKLVWITLREPAAELVTDAGRDQYERYAWFFPYANERIRALARRHPELAIADWQAAANLPEVTRDLIHLNPKGVSLMTSVVIRAVFGQDQAARARP